MAKYYVSCGSLSYIFSSNKTPQEAATMAMSDWYDCFMDMDEENAENAFLDTTIQVDERGLRYAGLNSDEKTVIFNTSQILQQLGLD